MHNAPSADPMPWRRARAGCDLRGQWCGTLRSFPKEFHRPPALLGQGSTSLSIHRNPLGATFSVAAVELGGEAKAGPSCGPHRSVQKYFGLAAARVDVLPVWGGGGLAGL